MTTLLFTRNLISELVVPVKNVARANFFFPRFDVDERTLTFARDARREKGNRKIRYHVEIFEELHTSPRTASP